MKRVFLQQNWPASWRYSYQYDLQEIYGEFSSVGYAYAYQNRRRYTLDFLAEVLPAGARVLDIAAAQGNFSLAIAEMGYDVTWNDLREDLADYVRIKYESGQISFAPGNAFDLDFPYLFDAVLITEVIEHVAHPDQFLVSTARLVRPGGYIIMTTPNGEYFLNNLPKFSECQDPSIFESVQFGPDADGHLFLLHRDEVEAFAATTGLQIDRFILFNNPLTSGHLKLRFLLRVLPKRFVSSVERWLQHLPAYLVSKVSAQMAVRFQVVSHD
jgi:2-polyprenyl-3-methyl-5-hydroxy-6-metoxy-1,4-benzoquinol methylase